jgi:hypothetical protein
VAYETHPSGTGQAMSAIAPPYANAPITTTTGYGPNSFHTGDTWGFGAWLKPPTSAVAVNGISVGTYSTVSVTESGPVCVGVNGSGRWQVSLNHVNSGGGLVDLDSLVTATLNAWEWVYVQCDGTYLYIYVAGILRATSSALSSVALTTFTYFYIGNETGNKSRPGVADLFWSHDTLSNDAILYLYNAGRRRNYADFATEPYGTDFDTYLASLLSAGDGFWKLNQTSGTSATDSVGSGIGAGTLTNGAAFINTLAPPPGFPNTDYIANFDGSNDYCDLPDIDYSSGSLSDTFGTWYYGDTTPAGTVTIMGARASGGSGNNSNHRRMFRASSGTTGSQRYNPSSTLLNNAPGPNPGNTTWAFIVGQYNATTKRLINIHNGYVTGGQQSATALTAANLSIGSLASNQPQASTFFDGKLSRAFWKKAGTLTIPQITKLYDLGNGAT